MRGPLLLSIGFCSITSSFAADNSESSLTLLFQNNLNASDDVNHVGFFLLDSASVEQQASICSNLGQSLLSTAAANNYSSDLGLSLAYQQYAGYTNSSDYIIDEGLLLKASNDELSISNDQSHAPLPALCSNAATESEPQNSTATADTMVSIAGGNNIYNGYFNKKSFRFLGIRYAQQPERFSYTQLLQQDSETINATAYGSQCLQGGGGSEDCFFLNVQTPYIPKAGTQSNLRPVMFWIHGGGFTGGTGADPLSDGSNLASREDLVVVTINYRLSTLGFLAVPGTTVTGNYGIEDQITALQWTIDNIAYFGGDPNRITIIGESAGAGSVRTLLGSPKAVGMYQGAVAMSNLGGGQDLGLSMNYGTTYSLYYSIAESYNVSGKSIINATNCTSESLDQSVSCLRAFNATTLVNLATVARYVVQDNIYVNTSELNVITPYNGTAHVPIIFGNVANDGASFSTYPPNPIAEGNLTGALQVGLDISASAAQSIIDSGLFPYENTTGNYTYDAFNVTQRVATDNTFRCIDQATVYAGATTGVFPATYYYQFERAIDGYNPNNLPGAPVEPGFPNGDPELPYFKLHGADMEWVFGNFYEPLRDDNDLYSVQLVSGYFAEFVRSGQPNPDVGYLKVRGYNATLEAVEKYGEWNEVASDAGPVHRLNYPSYSTGFIDVPQCAWLNYSISYYLEGQ